MPSPLQPTYKQVPDYKSCALNLISGALSPIMGVRGLACYGQQGSRGCLPHTEQIKSSGTLCGASPCRVQASLRNSEVFKRSAVSQSKTPPPQPSCTHSACTGKELELFTA
eukprot:scaffold209993_cov19-Tisochrysis_lutea.AAC.1